MARSFFRSMREADEHSSRTSLETMATRRRVLTDTLLLIEAITINTACLPKNKTGKRHHLFAPAGAAKRQPYDVDPAAAVQAGRFPLGHVHVGRNRRS